jgi:BRCT domain type II-containing protein
VNPKTLTAAKADEALKPFGIRVTAFGNSKTKFCVFWKDSGCETMLKVKVAEMIKVRQEFGQPA